MALPTRDDKGKLPAFAWPGGYEIIYFTKDGLIICAECANDDQKSSDPAVDGDVYWEGPAIQCDDCGRDMESEYGDPDED